MHKYLSLTKVLLKSGFQVTDGKNKRWLSVLLYLVLIVCFLPLLFVLYFGVDALLPLTARLDQTATILATMLFLTCIIIFFFSLFLIPSIFYFSSDLETLLALPLTSIQIIAAKFTVCVIYEYLFSFTVLLPTYAAYLHYGGMPVAFIPFGIITFLLIPIFPLVISTILTILLMRFVPFFKNRDRFNLISSILLVVLGMSFSILVNSQSAESESEIFAWLLAGNNSLLQFFMKLFPMIPYFSRAMVEGSISDLLIGIGISALALLVLFTLGRLLYFKGAIGSGETGASHKQMSAKTLQKATHQRSKISAYRKKEFKLLFRTPAYFTNCILSSIIFPILILVMPLLSQSEATEDVNLSDLLAQLETIDDFFAYVIMISLAMGFLMGTINQVAATAISREGKQYSVMKYLPMSYRDQIHAKMQCGIIIGLFTNVCVALALALILPFSWYTYLIYIGASAITTVFGNAYCIMFDLMKPKLVWEQEASAVKQNLGSFLAIMLSLALCIVIIVGCFYVPDSLLLPTAIGGSIVMIILAYLAYVLVGRYGEHVMRKL